MVLRINGAPMGVVAIGLAILASMGGFIFGYDTGQISGILIMPDFFNTYIEGLIVSALSIGTLIGAISGAPIADWLGRTKAMSLECLIFMLGVVIQVTAFQAWYQIMIGRLVAGISVGALSAAVPMYQSETAPKQIRGSLVGTYQLFITLGILVAACINIGTNTLTNSGSWRIPIALGIVFAAILAIGILFMPESPRWLVVNGRHDQAKHALARIHGVTNSGGNDHELVQYDYNEIQASIRLTEKLGKAGWLDCFKGQRKVRYRTFLGMALQMFQQLTGANYFFYYGATIFQGVGISNSFATQIILNAVNFVCTFLGLYVMEKFGRRWPLIIGGLWNSAWLFVFSSVGVAHDPQTDASTAKVMIVSACLFILGYASTWAPGIWILIGETFPLRTRAKQAALAVASNWFWNFMLAFWTTPVTGDIGYAYGYIFAGCNLAGALTVALFLYESSGITLEAVDTMYNDPSVKPWTSGKWLPEGYSTRRQARADIQSKDGASSYFVGDPDDNDAARKKQNEMTEAENRSRSDSSDDHVVAGDNLVKTE